MRHPAGRRSLISRSPGSLAMTRILEIATDWDGKARIFWAVCVGIVFFGGWLLRRGLAQRRTPPPLEEVDVLRRAGAI
jgi:hypothetical protein